MTLDNNLRHNLIAFTHNSINVSFITFTEISYSVPLMNNMYDDSGGVIGRELTL